MLTSDRRLCQNSFSTIQAPRRLPGNNAKKAVPHNTELTADGGCSHSHEQPIPSNCTAENNTMIQRRKRILVLRLRLSADDNLVATRVRHYLVKLDVVRIAHSYAAMRGRTEKNTIPPSCWAPTRPHRSVNKYPQAVEFLHVQLVRAEGITTQYGLTVRSTSSRTVFRRDMIFFPDSRSESSRRSHLPTTSHNYAACEQDSWILITLVLTSYCERTLRGLAVIDDSNRGWPTFAGLAKLGTYAVCVEAFIWPRPSD